MLVTLRTTLESCPSSLFEIAFLTSGSLRSQAPVLQPVESWDCMICSYRDSMMGATLEALLRGCKNCVVVTILGVLKVFHTIRSPLSVGRALLIGFLEDARSATSAHITLFMTSCFLMHAKQNIISIVTTPKPNTKQHYTIIPNGNKSPRLASQS